MFMRVCPKNYQERHTTAQKCQQTSGRVVVHSWQIQKLPFYIKLPSKFNMHLIAFIRNERNIQLQRERQQTLAWTITANVRVHVSVNTQAKITPWIHVRIIRSEYSSDYKWGLMAVGVRWRKRTTQAGSNCMLYVQQIYVRPLQLRVQHASFHFQSEQQSDSSFHS